MINVNELMIGDYVNVGADDCPPAVAVVEEIYGKFNRALLSICKSSVTFDADDISPIMLTKDFFLQNGFIELYTDEQLYNYDNRLRISMYPSKYFIRWSVNTMDINYVHEFQHLLRLVGLSEMANNLKI